MAARESFSPEEPLPAFTLPAVDEATKLELLKSVEAARARPQTSVERVAARDSFQPDEPLPAFTFPAVDEATKQELLRSVEEARAKAVGAAPPPPNEPPRPAAPRPNFASRGIEPARIVSDLQHVVREVWRVASAAAGRWIDRASAAIDRNRSRLPSRIRDPLSNVSARVLLLGLAAFFATVLIGLLLRLTRGHTEEQAAVPPPTAPSASARPEDTVPHEIDEAKKQGLPALEKLAEQFPNDSRVWLALADANSAKGVHAAAVEAVRKALAAAREANETDIASAALAQAVRKRDTADASFELLEGPMGAAGAAVLYDLSTDVEVRTQIRTRAEEWVRSDAFKKAAAPDVELAAALRYAKSCFERHDLLPRAAESGGKRVLDYLNIAKVRGGCGRRGRDDCFPCLRKDDALKTAISVLETRLAPK